MSPRSTVYLCTVAYDARCYIHEWDVVTLEKLCIETTHQRGVHQSKTRRKRDLKLRYRDMAR